MKRTIAFFLAAVSFALLAGCAKTVATVNGQAVTQKELDHALEAAGGQNMLETLIGRKLVEEDASAKHVSVSSAEIDSQLNQLKKNFSPTDQQSLTGDKIQTLRDEIRFNLLLKKAIMANVSDSEIRAYYEKNKDTLPEVELSAIVVQDPSQARAIFDELRRGKDFASLASQFSLDPPARSKGGYAGFFSLGNLEQISPALAQAAFSLKPGDVSNPVQTPRGWYLLKVLSKKTTFDALKDEIEGQMTADRAKSYLDNLRDKAKIDYKGEYAKR